MIPKKLRNYFHHIIKISLEENDEYYAKHYNDYYYSLYLWHSIIIHNKAEVDSALSYEKSLALTSNGTYTSSEGTKVQSLFNQQIKNAHSSEQKGLSIDSQVLKILEYFQKQSESEILITDTPFDPKKDAKIHKKAYAKWVLNDYQKPNFDVSP